MTLTSRTDSGARGARGRDIALASATALAAGAVLMNLQARWAERRHPPRGRFAVVDTVRVHYLDIGDGPPVVLLHGSAAMIDDLLISGVPQRLAGRRRTVLFDRPGFGHSTRPREGRWLARAHAALTRRVFAALAVARPVVVGHSWGALTALALALNHPDAVGGLVLVSGQYYPTRRPGLAPLAAAAPPMLAELLRHSVAPVAGWATAPRMLQRLFAPQPVPARFRAQWPLGLALRPSQLRAFAEDVRHLNDGIAELCPRYGDVSVPVAILAGAEDRVVDPGQAERLHRAVPHSTLRVLPGLGHMLHHFAQDEVVAAVEAVAAASAPPLLAPART